MEKKTENSVTAEGGSKISNVINASNTKTNLKKVKAEYTIIGFVLGIISELIASYIYHHCF
jgi:hypothetical protein